MAAEVEEVVMDADFFEFQNFSPDLTHSVFNIRVWGNVGMGWPRSVIVRCRESVAVEFAIGGEWKSVQGDEGRGNHEVGQGGGEMGSQVLSRDVGVGGEVSDEAFVIGTVFTSDDDGILDFRELFESGFDFTEFDAEATDFDLMIDTAEEFDIAIGEVTSEVTGFV